MVDSRSWRRRLKTQKRQQEEDRANTKTAGHWRQRDSGWLRVGCYTLTWVLRPCWRAKAVGIKCSIS